LKLDVPTGKLSEIPFIKSMFKTVKVKVEIAAVNGIKKQWKKQEKQFALLQIN
jgi:hypothetical protein